MSRSGAFKKLSNRLTQQVLQSYNSVQLITQALSRNKVEQAVEIINKEPYGQSEDSKKRFAIYIYFIMKLQPDEFSRAFSLLEDSCSFLRTFLHQAKLSLNDLKKRDKKTQSIIISKAIYAAVTLREQFVISLILDSDKNLA